MAEFIVTTLEDETQDNGALSLREAIALANTSGGADTITFADGLEGTIRLTEGELDSFGDLTVNGDGRITISGDALGNDVTADGITDVSATLAAEGELIADNVKIFDHRFDNEGEVVTLTLNGLTLTGGYSTFLGGAVDTDDYVDLQVINSNISGNYARNDGGGVYVGGEVTVVNSTFEGNLSGDEGGAISVQYGADITDSRIINNRSSDDGGGISVLDGDATITGGEVSGNRTDNFKGNQFNTNKGGGIYADGDIIIIGAIIADNTAEGNGGGLYAADNITITDATIEGNEGLNGGGAFGDDVTITGATIAGNTATRPEDETSGGIGGGVYARDEVIANDSVIRDNSAISSGGVESVGSVDIDNSTFSGNSAQFNGAVFTNNGGEIDGSVFLDNEGGAGTGAVVNSGTLTVTGSTFTGNTGEGAGAIYDQGDGLTVINSTFVDNSSDENAGAIRSRNGPVLDHVTITRNTSGENAGAVNVAGGTITNSIITSNTGGGLAGPDLTVLGGYAPYSGTITFTGVSIIGEDDTAFGSDGAPYNIINGAAEDILVTVVQDNGGPTPTLALLGVAENPALDATNNITQTADARGGPRPRDIDGVENGGTVDLGAFELNAVNLNGVGIVDEGNFGAEEILGTDDDDTLQGGGSFEDSVAGSGQDTIRGFGGDDLLDGEGGADSIEGGAGDDTIIGGPSNSEDRVDTILGGDGDDDINGGFFIDQIFGGAGDDTIRVIGDDDIDDVDGGDDIDTLDLTTAGPANGYTVDLERGDFLQLRFEGESLVVREGSIINVENVMGGAGNDLFNGDEQANQLEGGDGDDTLLGQGGDDLLEGGDGADLIEGGGGDDTLIGGGASDLDGVDTLSGGDGDDLFDGGFFEDQIFGGAGDDTVLINESDFADDIDGGDDIDTVDFSGVNADITIVANLATGAIIRTQEGRVPNDSGSLVNVENLIGGVRGDLLTGDDQANVLEGRGGDDTLIGGDGDDTLLGGDNNDLLVGDAGVNIVDGGDGQDIAQLTGARADHIVLAADGDERTIGRLEEGVIVEITTFNNVETFRFADQDVALDDLQVDAFVVTTLEDKNDLDGGLEGLQGQSLSLREAIDLANASEGADEIVFQDGLEGVIRLTLGQLRSRDDLSIDGDGRITITGDVDGNDVTDEIGVTDVLASSEAEGDLLGDNVRIIRADSADLTLDGLTLTGGETSGGGGAVGSFGTDGNTVTFIDSTVSGNFSNFDGGGVYAAGGVTIQNSVFSNNISGDDGGAIASYTGVDLIDSRITGNLASDEGGAVLARNGSVTITGGEISDNTTADFNDRDGDNEGGAVFADVDITVTDAVISGNNADETGGLHAEGGDIAITGTTLANNTAGVTGVGGAYASGAVVATNSAFIGNTGANVGAIYQAGAGATVTNTSFVGNVGGADAGAIAVQGNLTLDHVTITGNTSGANGGAVNIKTDPGAATITNSIIAGNEGGAEASSEITSNGGLIDANAVTFVGQNIVGEDETAFRASDFENALNGDPAVIFAAAVANNGGRVPTLALLAAADNPALDASAVVTQTKDGREVDRPVDLPGVNNGGAVDLGAFELVLDEDETPPEITSDLALSVQEGRSGDLALTPVTASDVDVITFSIIGGADADKVAIDLQTGVLSLNEEHDFEAPKDANGDNIFEVQVQVEDTGGNATVAALTITITDVNEAPVITSGAAFTAVENQTIAGAVTASDDQSGAVFSITGGADADLFAINASTGVLRFKTAPNFEAPTDAGSDNTYNVELTVSDSGGLTDIQAVSVTVQDVNDAPIAAPATVRADEDAAIAGLLTASDEDGDALAFSLNSGPSNGATTVNANGAFTFIPDADFNGADSFTFRVSDGQLSDVGTVTITVNPADEPVDPGDPAAPDDPADPGNPLDPADPDAPANPIAPPAEATGPTQGDDTLFGTAQNDTINALAGDDLVNGLNGDDFLIGGQGDDKIRGAGGDDNIRGNAGEDTLLGNGGSDDIRGNGGADAIRGGGAADTLRGNGGADDIRGNGGADVIRAGGGRDIVKGGGGADDIRGGGGADLLEGGGGQDILAGQGGADTLRGGAGADTFQFRASDNNDTILDFVQGQDKIEILSGAQSFDVLDIAQDGRDVLIGFGTGQVRVITDSVGAFDESDFIF